MLPSKKESLSGPSSQYEQMSRAALIRLLEEHDEALIDAGKDGIVMSYTGRTAPWQIIRLVKPKLRADATLIDLSKSESDHYEML